MGWRNAARGRRVVAPSDNATDTIAGRDHAAGPTREPCVFSGLCWNHDAHIHPSPVDDVRRFSAGPNSDDFRAGWFRGRQRVLDVVLDFNRRGLRSANRGPSLPDCRFLLAGIPERDRVLEAALRTSRSP
ncbi:hypothetical protein GCM10023346_19830 [Arthrobacter gyeryongensis]|uniref:Uncharacterized protein n=1 Tax=Arthrobacter gyeryongensis TaxID=1650592 RepID=A0ABP9SBL7_9MICC